MAIPVPTDAIARLGYYNASPLDLPYTMVGPSSRGYVQEWPRAMGDIATTAHYIQEVATTLVLSPDNSIDVIRVMTQSAYDALGTKDPSTLYVIKGN